MRTLIRVGQQGCLAFVLGTLAIDVCCIQETCIQNFRSVIRLAPLSSPCLKFYLRPSGDLGATVSVDAGVGVSQLEGWVALPEWIPVGIRLCAVRLGGSW